jgi:hypothetical protein
MAYTAPATSASRPYGAKMVPRRMSDPTVQVKVGSQLTARSQASASRASSTRSPSTRSTGRNSGSPRASRNDGEPATSTAARAPRFSTPSAYNAPSAGWMHGSASQ